MKKTNKLFLAFSFLIIVASCGEQKTKNKDESMPPSTESASASEVQKKMSDDGKFQGASYMTADGKTIQMKIVNGKAEMGRKNEIVFTSDDEVLLTIKSEVVKNTEGLGFYSLSVKGNGVNYHQEMDASSIILEEGKASSGIALINITSGEKSWSGSLDFATSEFSGLEEAVSFQQEIPVEIATLIDPLVKESVTFYKGAGAIGIQTLTFGQPIILASVTGSLCRAACWAGGSAVIAACCAGSGGWACYLCAAIWAADASLCADLCPA